ncbi:MAG: MBOAT family protein [Eubacterium sp.]|nr:MBOAT family protein [Eubacterium sp.]
MSFGSLEFIFLFLPVSVLIYRLIPGKKTLARKIVLLVFSILFYIWGDAANSIVLAVSVFFNYVSGQQIRILAQEENQARRKKITLISTVAVNVLVLGIFKYSRLSLPIGISFYTFSALSYVFDIYYGRAEDSGSLLDEMLYILFFPKVLSGPIMQYKDFRRQLSEIPDSGVRRSDFNSGMYLFIIGLFKKVLIADNLGTAFGQISSLQHMAGLTAWLGMIYYSLELYFDFSGYSDMAIGLARMFGFHIEKNFDDPYLSDGVTDFWRRWHISLGAWFRDYVYIPMGGNRCSKEMQLRNLSFVWILTGLWHGNTLNFLFWGIYHGFFVILEKFVIGKARMSIPKPVRIFLTDLIAFFGWIFFFTPSLGGTVHYIGQMFGADGLGFADSASIYYLTGNLVLLIAAVLCCGPVLKQVHASLVYRGGKKMVYVSAAVHAVLLIFCVANMVGSTYSTFLYFRF